MNNRVPKTKWTAQFYDDHRVDTEWVNWRCWFPFLIATILVGTLLLVLALWWGGHAYFNGNVQEQTMEYFASGYLNPSVRLHKLSSAGTAIQIQLPNDLKPYLNQRHTIVSTTNQAHTVVIDAGGANPTWDKPGSSLTATFGGAINDGFSFRVVTNGQIHVESNQNVAFS